METHNVSKRYVPMGVLCPPPGTLRPRAGRCGRLSAASSNCETTGTSTKLQWRIADGVDTVYYSTIFCTIGDAECCISHICFDMDMV